MYTWLDAVKIVFGTANLLREPLWRHLSVNMLVVTFVETCAMSLTCGTVHTSNGNGNGNGNGYGYARKPDSHDILHVLPEGHPEQLRAPGRLTLGR